LPVLARVFPGQDEALTRITAAYMQVHYGDQPVGLAELAQLRQDYQKIRTAEKEVTGT
jgi:streptomycin 6-kinase